MANSEHTDLMAVGQHCAHPDCRQLDFLPFRCSKCETVYCLEHRVCPCSQQASDTVLVCPICAKAVVCGPGQDPELVFDRHTRADCDPANYDRVHRKPRCPVAQCKEKLTTISSYTCRDCGATVCLRHRLPTDHKCPGKPATAASTAARSLLHLPQSFRRMFSSTGGGGSSSSAAAGAAAPRHPQQPAAAAASGGKPTNGQRAAAAATKTRDNVQSQLQQYRQQQQRGQPPPRDVVDLTTSPAAASMRGPAVAAPAAAGAQEVCQQCGARFTSVQQLIEHAESAHTGGWSSGDVGMQQAARRQQAGAAAGGGLERCPHCGQQFADAVQLVAHVERQHAAAAAGGKESCVVC